MLTVTAMTHQGKGSTVLYIPQDRESPGCLMLPLELIHVDTTGSPSDLKLDEVSIDVIYDNIL